MQVGIFDKHCYLVTRWAAFHFEYLFAHTYVHGYLLLMLFRDLISDGFFCLLRLDYMLSIITCGRPED